MFTEIRAFWIGPEDDNDIWKETSDDRPPIDEVVGIDAVVPLKRGSFIRKLTHASMCESESFLEPAKFSYCRKIGVATAMNFSVSGYVPVHSISRKKALTSEFDRVLWVNAQIMSCCVFSGYGSKVVVSRGASSRHLTSSAV